jgi:DNA gyrase subunit B
MLSPALEEAMVKRCTQIDVTLLADGGIQIRDNTVGLTVEEEPTPHIQLVRSLPSPFSFLRFMGDAPYRINKGLGNKVIRIANAVSEWFIIEVRQGGYVWRQRFKRGELATELRQVRYMNGGEPTGNTFMFLPDIQVFPGFRRNFEFEFQVLATHLQQFAYIVPGLTLSLSDERNPALREVYSFPQGIRSLVEEFTRECSPFHDILYRRKLPPLAASNNTKYEIELAFQYAANVEAENFSYVNTQLLTGGTHIAGFKRALRETWNQYRRTHSALAPQIYDLTESDVLRGLVFVINMRHSSPVFDTTTHTDFKNLDMAGEIAMLTASCLGDFVADNPDAAKQILEYLAANQT